MKLNSFSFIPFFQITLITLSIFVGQLVLKMLAMIECCQILTPLICNMMENSIFPLLKSISYRFHNIVVRYTETYTVNRSFWNWISVRGSLLIYSCDFLPCCQYILHCIAMLCYDFFMIFDSIIFTSMIELRKILLNEMSHTGVLKEIPSFLLEYLPILTKIVLDSIRIESVEY